MAFVTMLTGASGLSLEQVGEVVACEAVAGSSVVTPAFACLSAAVERAYKRLSPGGEPPMTLVNHVVNGRITCLVNESFEASIMSLGAVRAFHAGAKKARPQTTHGTTRKRARPGLLVRLSPHPAHPKLRVHDLLAFCALPVCFFWPSLNVFR